MDGCLYATCGKVLLERVTTTGKHREDVIDTLRWCGKRDVVIFHLIHIIGGYVAAAAVVSVKMAQLHVEYGSL